MEHILPRYLVRIENTHKHDTEITRYCTELTEGIVNKLVLKVSKPTDFRINVTYLSAGACGMYAISPMA